MLAAGYPAISWMLLYFLLQEKDLPESVKRRPPKPVMPGTGKPSIVR